MGGLGLLGEGNLHQAAAALWHLWPLLAGAVLMPLRSKALAAAAALWFADRACLQRGPAPTLAVKFSPPDHSERGAAILQAKGQQHHQLQQWNQLIALDHAHAT